MDRFTRWPEAIPITDTGTETCARALLLNWIARFGVPLHLTSDRGAQFTYEIWNVLTAHLGIKTHHTTAYHLQANGLDERFHRTLKAALKARLRNQNWMDELPWVLLGIRTAPKEDLHASSAELAYGYPLTVPGIYLPSQHNKSFAASVFGNLALSFCPQRWYPSTFAEAIQRPFLSHRTRRQGFQTRKRESYGHRIGRQAETSTPRSRGPSTSRPAQT